MKDEVKRILDTTTAWYAGRSDCQAQQIGDLYKQKMRELFGEIEEHDFNKGYCPFELIIEIEPEHQFIFKHSGWQSLKEKYLEKRD